MHTIINDLDDLFTALSLLIGALGTWMHYSSSKTRKLIKKINEEQEEEAISIRRSITRLNILFGIEHNLFTVEELEAEKEKFVSFGGNGYARKAIDNEIKNLKLNLNNVYKKKGK